MTADTNTNNFKSGIAFAIAGTALFSLKSIFIKLAFEEGIDATTLLTLRMLIAFPFYIMVLIYALNKSKGSDSIDIRT